MNLTQRESYIFGLLVNGWVAENAAGREFRINNGPPEDMSIIDRLARAGLVVQSSARTYVAAVCPWPYSSEAFQVS